MRKEIYLIGGNDVEAYSTFRDRMLATTADILDFYHPEKISVTLTEERPPALSVIPFQKKKIAAISVFRQPADQRPYTLITKMDGFRSLSLVDEVIPVGYQKSWPDRTITPGICLLTLFRKRPDISQELFIDRWHNSHTPLSLRIHPLWHYNRNVVTGAPEKREPEWGGIVEEHVRTRSHLLNPFRFFGNPLVIVGRMWAVWKDTNAFLDYRTIETYLVREYHFKS